MKKNAEIAKIFYLISEYLEMEEDIFRPAAYQKAAFSLENFEKDVEAIYQEQGKKGLKGISGVGEGLAEKIIEYLETGSIKYYEDLKKKAPVDIESLTAVEGLGPKRIKILYQKLGIRDLKDLEKAAKSHNIAPLFGFGEKTEQNILEGIGFLKRSRGRSLLIEIMPVAEDIEQKAKALKSVKEITAVGSLRRRKETVGDLDFLVVSDNPGEVMDFFVSLPEVVKVWGKGKTKTSIRLKQGFDVDVRVVPKKSYGAALQYFTGSKEHNIATRKVAIGRGLKLNEYGLFKEKKMIAGEDEEGVYRALGMSWISPELREDQGEIKAALEGKLPNIITREDIQGDLHCHTVWNGGESSIEEMAEKAQSLGYQYLGIADHTKFLKIENGLDEKQLSEQRKQINKVNLKLEAQTLNPDRRTLNFKILQGAETNILKNGSIDITNDALKKLDYAIAGVHSQLKMSKDEMTERIIKAMKNPYINIISHPTGRLIKRREEYRVDFAKILRVAKEFGIILEINASPQRLDLNEQYIRQCKEQEVRMIINTDAHHVHQMEYINFGLFQARRGWAEARDIVNTSSLKEIISIFRKP